MTHFTKVFLETKFRALTFVLTKFLCFGFRNSSELSEICSKSRNLFTHFHCLIDALPCQACQPQAVCCQPVKNQFLSDNWSGADVATIERKRHVFYYV